MMLQSSAKDQLRAFVARIERLEEEKAALSTDLKEVYAEAKGSGFDTKALRKIIAMRKRDENTRREEEAVLATYLHALGMQADLFDDEPSVEVKVLVDDDEDQAELAQEVAEATEEVAEAAA